MIQNAMVVDGVLYSAYPGTVKVGTTVVLSPVEALSAVVVSSPRVDLVPQVWQKMSLNYSVTDFMPVTMRDHFVMLGESMKPFWIQMDDFFAYRSVVCARVDSVTYLVPFRPVFPYDYVPNGPIDFTGSLTVNGVPNNNFVIDQRSGKITFGETITNESVVRIHALRRFFCRLSAPAKLEPGIPVAQSYYQGTIELTEVEPTATDIVSCRYVPSYTGGTW